MWKKIYFNENNIEYDTGRAFLINMPSTSHLKGWKFWYPVKLIKEYKKIFYLLYKDEWEKEIIKNDQKKIMEMDEIATQFKNINLNEKPIIESKIIVPEKIEGKRVVIDEDLIE